MLWSNEKVPKHTRRKTAKVYKKRGKFIILKLSKTIINFLKKLRGGIADRPPPPLPSHVAPPLILRMSV
jgi:hypothetical protein